MTIRNCAAPEKTLLSANAPLEGQSHGSKLLSIATTVWFLVATAAGAGLLGLPHALSSTGWIGVFILVMMGGACLYTGHILGRCVMMVRERYSDKTEMLRYPYPAVGEVTYGPKLRVCISLFVNVTMMGESVVFLILAAESVSEFLELFSVKLTPCSLTVIIALVLCPVTWCGTPKDFWPLAFIASTTMQVAAVFLIFAMLRDAGTQEQLSTRHNYEWDRLFMAFGTFFYAYGAHPTLPTYQTDMKEPHRFTIAAVYGFLIISVAYFLVSIEGYLVYGSNLKDNLMLNVMPGPLLTTIQVLITLHVFCTFVMALNPICQEGEELFNIPPKFCFRRVLLRTAVVSVVLFVSLSVPQFGVIMAFMGGATIGPLTFIFPCLCYLKICSMTGSWETKELPLHEKVACVELIIVGAVLGVGASTAALSTLTNSEFSRPCYLS